MVEVEPWAVGQRRTLSYLSPQPVTEKDFTDDRLADVLRALSQDQAWQEVETRLGQRLVRVYNLKRKSVRLDSTAVGVGLLNAGMACATASQGGTLHTIEDLAFGPVSFSQQLTGVQRNTPLTIM